MDEAIAKLQRALYDAQRVIDNVREDQLTNPTPDGDWDVRAVIHHLVVGNILTVAVVRGEQAPDRTADHLGRHFRVAFEESSRAVVQALETPSVLDEEYDMPFGKVSGRRLAAMRRNEALAHAWDIAVATGQSTNLDPELAEEALNNYRALLDGRDRSQMPFDAEQPAPPGANAADRLAAYLGRRVPEGT